MVFSALYRSFACIGEFVLFNRSWYNRAGVEKVMGFCTKEEYKSFFTQVELFETGLVESGFIIIKITWT